MKYKSRVQVLSLLVCAAAAGIFSGNVSAQSAEKAEKAAQGSAMKEAHGSGMKKMEGKMGSGSKRLKAPVALDGYCPVCIVAGKGLVKGEPSINSVQDGKKYLFPSQEVKGMFDADLVKFTPVLGGDCVVCLKMLGKRVPGKPEFSSVYEERLYLFPDNDVKDKFDAAPQNYVDVDLAADGNCTVCTVELNKTVPGVKEFTAIHKGMRYQFPAQEQKDMFMANPTKYEVAEPAMMK